MLPEKEEKTQKTETVKTLSATQSAKKKKLSYKDKYEYEQLEIEIEKLEKEKNELETALDDTDISYEKMMDKSEKLGKTIELIDEKSFRWMELDELANEIKN